jgi:spermidine synthase
MTVRRLFVALCILSGAAGLVYQTVWSRLVTLAMGHTAGAIGTALAAFLGGLALGALLAGRHASRLTPRAALVRSAFLEAFIAIAALLIIPALAALRPLLSSAYQASQDAGSVLPFAGARVLACLLVITLPAAGIGATWALRLRWFESVETGAGRVAGTLYASVAFGAALGAAISGFLLLPFFGLTNMTLVGVALNVLIAAGFLSLQQRVDAPSRETALALADHAHHADHAHYTHDPAPTHAHRHAHTHGSQGGKARPLSAAVALAISGFIALTYLVAWTRVLALTLGPTRYVLTLALTVFTLGIAVGAALAARVVSRIARPIMALAATQIVAALAAFIAARLVPSVPALVATLLGQWQAYPIFVLVQSAVAVMLLLPIAIALGAAFPFGVATAAPDRSRAAAVDAATNGTGHVAVTARVAARVFGANMLGAIGGLLLAGFVFVPRFGLQRTILLGGLIGALSGVELTWRSRKRDHTRIWMATVGVLTAVLGLTLPPWNPKMLSGGAYRYRGLSPSELQVELDAGTLLFHDDDAEVTVAVRRVAGEMSMVVDGAIGATNAGSTLTEKLLAHVPLLLHPAPNDICVIGLGSGITTGAALAHPVDRVDTVERSREVVRAAQLFAADNHQALSDPRTHLLLGDGRAHLRFTRRTYDIIVSAPSQAWMAGAAPLFTRELFDAARDRLNPGGLFCQWARAGQLSRQDLQSIIATFAEVFPGGTLWQVGERDLLLIGGREPTAPLLANVWRAWRRPGVAEDLAQVDVRDPFSVLSLLVAQGTALEALAAGAAPQTDDLAALEFSAARGLQDPTDRTGLAWLAQLQLELRPQRTSGAIAASRPAVVVEAEAAAGAREWRNRAVMLLRADAPALAYDAAARALALDPSDAETLTTLSHAATTLEREPEAVNLLEQLVARAPNSLAPLVELSRLRAASGQTDGAIEAATQATRQFPDMFAGWEQRASLLVRAGDVPRLADVLDHMETTFGDRWETSYYEGTLHLLRGEFGAAARLGEHVLILRPTEPRALNLTGAAYAALGVRDRAREAYEASLNSEPRDPAAYVTLGRFELDTFNPQRAAALFTEALFLDPRSSAALNGLADALARMGRNERAAELRARAGTF